MLLDGHLFLIDGKSAFYWHTQKNWHAGELIIAKLIHVTYI
jgi:hypothetical protein